MGYFIDRLILGKEAADEILATRFIVGFIGMTGLDPLDATSVALPGAERLARLRPASLAGLRIGLPREYFGPGIDPGVRAAITTALVSLESQGAILVDVSLPHTTYAIDTYYLISTSEVASNLARFDGIRFGPRQPGADLRAVAAGSRDAGFGAEAKRRILLGTFCLSKGYYDAFYLRALKARTLITRDFTQAFEQVDVLATPVCPQPAFRLGEKTGDPLAMYLSDLFTVTPALAGLPALAMPAGFADGLPVGLQLIGPALADVRLLELAQAYQQITEHHKHTPQITI